ncbi:MBL fold metallo-hydrolase [Dyella agri]|uniref:MBL fold metallo-hydrolase n=1 Tax=Dyella agri TaxID=1926869 RepID=A0ABW8KH21_9GAMM
MKPHPPLEVHAYNDHTYILRENLCATFEAPFMYLLVGSSKALLIDTGDVADPKRMPLAQTVMRLLPGEGASKMPLIVVHTHGHLDHRAGDPQFEHLPGATVVYADLDHVRSYFHFADWPNGLAQVDLGGRIIDVLPVPGHYPSHIAFYDRTTGLFFSGDFFLPGRLLIDDTAEDQASAKRVVDFVANRPVSQVLGGHVEMDRAGNTFPFGSTYHPGERALPMSKADLLRLPAILDGFNGLYAEHDGFTIIHQPHEMMALGVAALVILVLAIALVVWLVRRWKRARRRRALALA